MMDMGAVEQRADRGKDVADLALLLEGIYRQYGYDFRDYSMSSSPGGGAVPT